MNAQFSQKGNSKQEGGGVCEEKEKETNTRSRLIRIRRELERKISHTSRVETGVKKKKLCVVVGACFL